MPGLILSSLFPEETILPLISGLAPCFQKTSSVLIVHWVLLGLPLRTTAGTLIVCGNFLFLKPHRDFRSPVCFSVLLRGCIPSGQVESGKTPYSTSWVCSGVFVVGGGLFLCNKTITGAGPAIKIIIIIDWNEHIQVIYLLCAHIRTCAHTHQICPSITKKSTKPCWLFWSSIY